MPNYPDGMVPSAYRGRIFMREKWNQLTVLRTWIYVTPNKGFAKRILNHLSFMFSSWLAFSQTRHADIIISESPPLFLGLSGVLMAKLARAKHVFNVADLWPESAVEMGALKDPRLIRWTYKVAHVIYRHSHLITVTAAGQKRRLVKQGVPRGKIVHISNGVDTQLFHPNGAQSNFKREHGLEGKFVVFYGGTLGMAHGLDSVVEAAGLLSDEPDIQVVLAGGGAERQNLIGLAEKSGLNNIRFLDVQPREKMPDIINGVDVCLVHLRNLRVFEDVLPSKTFEYMACGKPVIMAVRGEAKKIIERAKAGLCVTPEAPHELAKAIRDLRNRPAESKTFGKNGRLYVERYLSRNRIAKQLESTLFKLMSQEDACHQPNYS